MPTTGLQWNADVLSVKRLLFNRFVGTVVRILEPQAQIRIDHPSKCSSLRMRRAEVILREREIRTLLAWFQAQLHSQAASNGKWEVPGDAIWLVGLGPGEPQRRLPFRT